MQAQAIFFQQGPGLLSTSACLQTNPWKPSGLNQWKHRGCREIDIDTVNCFGPRADNAWKDYLEDGSSLTVKKTARHHRDTAAVNRSSFLNHPHCSVFTIQTDIVFYGCLLTISLLGAYWWNQDWRRDETEGKYLDGAGRKFKTAERAFPHVVSSYALVQGWLPDVLCNATQKLGGGGVALNLVRSSAQHSDKIPLSQ